MTNAKKQLTLLLAVLLFLLGSAAYAQSDDDEDLTEVTLEDGSVQFIFSHPSEWVGQELDSPFPAMQFANSDELLQRDPLGGSGEPLLVEGDFAVAIYLSDQRQFANSGDLGNFASLADTADFVAQTSGQFLADIEVCGFMLDDHSAAQISGHFGDTDGLDILMLLVDMGLGTEYRQLGQVVAISPNGEISEYTPALLELAASMEVLEDDEPRLLDDAEPGVELPECDIEPQATQEPNDQ